MKHRLHTTCLICALAINIIHAQTALTGTWSGKLKVSPIATLNIALHITTLTDGTFEATMDSPDQSAFGIPADISYLSDDSLSIAVPRIGMTYRATLKNGKLKGTFTQPSLKKILTLAPDRSTPSRPQTPQPPFPYTTREVTFTNPEADATLAGTLTLPEGCNRSTPVLLMVTGSGLQNRDEELFGHRPFAVIADHLARHGIATLRYDDRGYGQSTGDPATATTADFASDAAAGIDYLRKKERFKRVGILGHSEGATIAFTLAATRKPDMIVALGAPATRGDSILADQNILLLKQSGIADANAHAYATALLDIYAARTSADTTAIREAIDRNTAGWDSIPTLARLKTNLHRIVTMSSPWLDYFASYSPAHDITATRCPALALYGGKDTQVTPELNMPRMQTLNPSVTTKLYPGLNHMFQHATTGSVAEYSRIEETISPEVLADIVSFINR